MFNQAGPNQCPCDQCKPQTETAAQQMPDSASVGVKQDIGVTQSAPASDNTSVDAAASAPTPRTDAKKITLRLAGEDFTYADYTESCNLERENAALRAMLDAEPSEAMIDAARPIMEACEENRIISIRKAAIQIFKAMRAAQKQENET